VKKWVTKEVDDRIAQMADSVRRFRYRTAMRTRPFVTLSREYGCDGFEVASSLAARLNALLKTEPSWAVYDRSLVEKVAGDFSIAKYLIESMTTEHRTAFEDFLRNMVLRLPSRDLIFRRTARVVKSLAWHGHAVIVGRGGVFLCADMPVGFHMQLVAPFSWRLERLAQKKGKNRTSALERDIKEADRERKYFYLKHFQRDICCPYEFDLVINNSLFSPDQIVDLALMAMGQRGLI
jgi:cytidylate kinase